VPTGLVEPNKPTLTALSARPGGVTPNPPPEEAEEEENVRRPRRTVCKGGVVLSGVNRKLIYLIQEVALHYGRDPLVTDGFRTPARMAQTLFNNWAEQEFGMNYGALKRNMAVRDRLHALWQAKDQRGFLAEATPFANANKWMSWHMKGEALDLRRSTVTAPMKRTLLMYLRSYNASKSHSFIHFDTGGRTLKASYSKTEKARWAR
ncbi:MAG: hypothetical protein AAF631_14705, partial [Pseudomonadota bacterium]